MPIVASNVGGIPELVTSNVNGYLFEKADAGIRDGQPFHHEKCPPAVSEEQKVNDWERAGGIYMEMLERCKETLDEVVIPADEDVRFRAANEAASDSVGVCKGGFLNREESGKERYRTNSP